MSETPIVKSIQLAVGALLVKLFRNNVGMLEDKFGNKVRYGLAPGSSDLIGWKPVTITPEMVGNKIAVFVAVEVKKPGSRTDKARLELQKNFVAAVNKDGGIAGFVESVDDATRMLRL